MFSYNLLSPICSEPVGFTAHKILFTAMEVCVQHVLKHILKQYKLIKVLY